MISCEQTSEMQSSFAQHLLAKTPSLHSLAERLAAAAATDDPVLLTGETGTGKSHLARFIHNFSPRRDYRLVVVSCSALAPHLLMNELFGHGQGGFRGEDPRRVGRFETAGMGTLLLDEIDTLTRQAQTALLRVIETGTYKPVDSRKKRLCRARIVTVSNGNLQEAVAEKRFREDLYQRLQLFSVNLPPLRRRTADIEVLVRAMVNRFADKYCVNPSPIHPETLRVLKSFPWPGNIRQLENSIQHAILLSSGSELRIEHFPEEIRNFSTDCILS
jgi:DNA-binding NtrC family response regulator